VTTTVTRYNLHGVTIRVAGVPEVAEMILRRLSSFRSDYAENPDLDFVLASDELSADSYHADSGGARSIYELEGGEVLYRPATDTITARFQDSVRMTCNVPFGKTIYSVNAAESAYRAASHILFTLPLVELLRRRGLYNVHAAGLCRGNDAILLAGPSGAGKSTLTLAMLQTGWEYMGDDMLFLKKDCVDVFGFPEGIDYFPGSGAQSVKTHLCPEVAFGQAGVLQALPRLLLFPSVAHSSETVLRSMDPTEAFLELAPNVLMSDLARCEAHFEVLAELTRKTPAFRSHTGRDLGQAERMIGDLFESLRPVPRNVTD
jgi:hypothetical protein